MLRHLPRLLMLWRVAARYRLDTLLPLPPHPLLSLLILLFRLHPAWWLAGADGRGHDRLRRACEELGPLYIKFGQLLATRRDLLPEPVLDELARLQDRVPPFASAQAVAIVEAELGQPVEAVFRRFDREPLAAASIAQVHTAALPDGQEVVVKIARPGIEAVIRADLALLSDLTAWLEARSADIARFHPHRIIIDYERILLDECDLSKEAQNQQTLGRNFQHSPLLYVPALHPELCTKRVIVMERITGVPMTDFTTLEASGISREKLAEHGFTVFFTQVFRDNFFHADMHPGNVFVDTAQPELARFIALDCAIIGSLAKADQVAVARLALALTHHDYSEMVSIAQQAGWLPPGVDSRALEREIAELLAPVLSKPIDQIEFGPTLLGLLDLCRRHRLEVPTQFALLVKTLVHVEGLGRSLYPTLDIWTLGKPLLVGWLNEQVGPAALFKRLTDSAPTWLAGLPDMPQLVFDALSELRDGGRRHREQQAELAALRASLERERQRDLVTFVVSAVTLTLAVLSAQSGSPVVAASLGGIGGGALVLRLLR